MIVYLKFKGSDAAGHREHFPSCFPYFSSFSNFHTGEPFLITPEGQLWEKGILATLGLGQSEPN